MREIQEEKTPEQIKAILMEHEQRKACQRLEEWRNKVPGRGYAVHSMMGGRVGVRLYENEIIQTGFIGRTLTHAVEELLKGDPNDTSAEV
jgi:hypothetical protein